MTAEMAPKKQIEPFVAALSEITGAGEKPGEIYHATISLKELEVGVLYDPRLAVGRMMLALQEKGNPASGIARRTVRVELYASRFKVVSYSTGVVVEAELQKQIDDVKAQEEPLEYERGYAQVIEAFDDLDLRLKKLINDWVKLRKPRAQKT